MFSNQDCKSAVYQMKQKKQEEKGGAVKVLMRELVVAAVDW